MTSQGSGLVALVLAAGAARRFGGGKLSAPFRGEPLVHHAIRAARSAPVSRVVVVCGDGLALGDWAGQPAVESVRIASAALSDSLKAGVVAAANAAGVFVFLGDMPLVPHDIASKLAGALDGAYAVLPRHAGKRGHPVLLSHRAFADIAGLSGDEGAGRLLKRHDDDVALVDVDAEGILLDVDTADDLHRLAGKH